MSQRTDRTENAARLKNLLEVMAEQLSVKHTAAFVNGAHENRTFVGALVTESETSDHDALMTVRVWEDGVFDVSPHNAVGEQTAAQVNSMWSELLVAPLIDIPKLETKWRHRNGAEYEVYDITNADADPGRELDHPISISYKGANGKRWSKPLVEFLNKMTPLGTSAWVERRERINAECQVAFDVEEPAQPGKPRILSSMHQVQVEPVLLEYPVPTFHQITDLKHFTLKTGANIFVDADYTGDGVIEDDRHALIVDCWNAQRSYDQRAVHRAARPHLERWQFCTMTRGMHSQLHEQGIGVITNHNLPGPGKQHHIIMPPPMSTLGGPVFVLATLAALLRQIGKEFQNELADAITLRKIQLRFNDLANAEINYSRATAFGVPQIVYPRGECPQILLPAGIRNSWGMMVEPPAEYAKIFFEDHRLIVDLPRDITECMITLFGPDFLMGILRD